MQRIFAKVNGAEPGKQYFEVYAMNLFNPLNRERTTYQVALYRRDYGACSETLDNIEIIVHSHPWYATAVREVDNA